MYTHACMHQNGSRGYTASFELTSTLQDKKKDKEEEEEGKLLGRGDAGTMTLLYATDNLWDVHVVSSSTNQISAAEGEGVEPDSECDGVVESGQGNKETADKDLEEGGGVSLYGMEASLLHRIQVQVHMHTQ